MGVPLYWNINLLNCSGIFYVRKNLFWNKILKDEFQNYLRKSTDFEENFRNASGNEFEQVYFISFLSKKYLLFHCNASNFKSYTVVLLVLTIIFW